LHFPHDQSCRSILANDPGKIQRCSHLDPTVLVIIVPCQKKKIRQFLLHEPFGIGADVGLGTGAVVGLRTGANVGLRTGANVGRCT
jgi:hypothetical protein